MQKAQNSFNRNGIMEHPFPKSTSAIEKCKRLWEVVGSDDVLGIVINADPDSMASALALKRLFWRKAKKILIYHINPIERADNLAFIKLLKIEQENIRNVKRSLITKWAVVDSQPEHNDLLKRFQFHIIIDHHPVLESTKAPFVDIKPEYGANSTIMTEYLKAARIKPSPTLATALFYGIKTDTDNFVRNSLPNDVNAFRYLYKFVNMNVIKKIESSEMTVRTLDTYRKAMDRLIIHKDIAFVYMEGEQRPDWLVMVADFFMRLAEVTWALVSGIHRGKVVVIIRNAGLRGNAGKLAERLFSRFGGSGGGHASAGRAEVPLANLEMHLEGQNSLEKFLLSLIKSIR